MFVDVQVFGELIPIRDEGFFALVQDSIVLVSTNKQAKFKHEIGQLPISYQQQQP